MFEQIRRWVCRQPGGDAQAAHIQNEDAHAVAFGALRVLICKDGEAHWFAQGIDLDYAAGGTSLDDAKHRFEQGLHATVQAHLERFGTIERLLKTPPTDAWLPLLQGGQGFEFSSTTMHDLQDKGLPFRQLAYIEGHAKAA